MAEATGRKAIKIKSVKVVCVKARFVADKRFEVGKKYKVPERYVVSYPEAFVPEGDYKPDVVEEVNA